MPFPVQAPAWAGTPFLVLHTPCDPVDLWQGLTDRPRFFKPNNLLFLSSDKDYPAQIGLRQEHLAENLAQSKGSIYNNLSLFSLLVLLQTAFSYYFTLPSFAF